MKQLLAALRSHPKTYLWLRRLAPLVVIVVWLAIGGIGGPTFGKLSSVSTNDQTAFLPASAQSTKVQEMQTKFRNSRAIPAIIVLESDTAINPATHNDPFAVYTLPILSLFGSIPGIVILTIMAADVYFLVKRQRKQSGNAKLRVDKDPT